LAEDWTVIKVLQWTAEHLRQKGVDNGRLDAELLLAETLGLDRVGLYLNYDKPLLADELSRYRAQVKRRAGREPLQYILGHCEFWSLSLQVTPEVLIPRPDTEVLVEEALKHVGAKGRLLDVGAGVSRLIVWRGLYRCKYFLCKYFFIYTKNIYTFFHADLSMNSNSFI
jgi:release factor glutamine methyltransferase